MLALQDLHFAPCRCKEDQTGLGPSAERRFNKKGQTGRGQYTDRQGNTCIAQSRKLAKVRNSTQIKQGSDGTGNKIKT